MTISSFYIIKGELHIKTEKYNRGHPVKLVIDPNHKVLFSQLKMASNCISKCLTQSQRIVKNDLESIPNVSDEKMMNLVTACDQHYM